MGKPLWAVPAPPWAVDFRGSRRLLEEGAHALTSIQVLLDSLHLQRNASLRGSERASEQRIGMSADRTDGIDPEANPEPDLGPQRSIEEMMVFRATSAVPLHVDEIASRTGLSMSTVAPSLLTLALENVVVEGPAGFFRRHKS